MSTVHDTIHDKLPKQHWIVRYGGWFISLLIISLLLTLYQIKMPLFFNIELHQASNQVQLTGIVEETARQLLDSPVPLEIVLENGTTASFEVVEIQQHHQALKCTLNPQHLSSQQQLFLREAYISVGKIKAGKQSLISSLIP